MMNTPHYTATGPYLYQCSSCPTPCDKRSKGSYIFANDAAFSEAYEQRIIAYLNAQGRYRAAKCMEPGYPDIVLSNAVGRPLAYIEVKVQQRTFMTIGHHLPLSGLQPSETVALNLSDLQRYLTIQQQCGLPISIVWALAARPCITGPQEVCLFYQKLGVLGQIYARAGDTRRFRRQSGEGDVVEGQHKGVTVNYHFSLQELLPWQAVL
jgi:hypothetical protein